MDETCSPPDCAGLLYISLAENRDSDETGPLTDLPLSEEKAEVRNSCPCTVSE